MSKCKFLSRGWWVGPLIIVVALLFASIARADETIKLVTLKSLPKPLLAWGQSNFDSNTELSEWTRVSGSAPIHLRWTEREKTQRRVQAAAKHGAILAVTYSPMLINYRSLEKEYENEPDATRWSLIRAAKVRYMLDLGPRWTDELEWFRGRVKSISEVASEFGIPSEQVVFMLDHEYSVINEMTVPVLCHKLNLMVDVVIDRGMKVFWYNHGSWREDNRGKDGWSIFPHVPDCVLGEWASTSLYWPTEIHHMRETMQRTLAGDTRDVVPFVSLGWSWTRVYDKGRILRTGTRDYPIVHSMILGDDINKTWKARRKDALYFDNTRIPFVFMWPGVDHVVGLPKGSASDGIFWRHFYAYHKGSR